MDIPGAELLRRQLGRGRQEFAVRRRDLTDRMIASDPGRTHLRLGIKVGSCIASVLAVEWALAAVLHRPPVVAMVLGGVVAMLLSSGIRENTRRATIRAAWPGLPAAAIGSSLSILTAPWELAHLALFVIVSFGAVYIRRFGGAFLSYGMLCWQSYFFMLFLKPPIAELPYILAVAAVAVAWVTLLLTTVLFENPADRLRYTVDALRARCRAAISGLLDVLDSGSTRGARPTGSSEAVFPRTLRSELVQLGQTALLIDGQLSEARALPDQVQPSTVRQWVIDIEIAMDDLVRSVTAPAIAALDERHLGELRTILTSLGWAEYQEASIEVEHLLREDEPAALQRVGRAASRLLVLSEDWRSGRVLALGQAPDEVREDPEDEPQDSNSDDDSSDVGDDEYESVVTLRGGRLSGTAPLAEEALARQLAGHTAGGRSQRLRGAVLGLRLTTRQAIQASVAATLAIGFGYLISPQRYYWAVISAFIAFANAATASETLRRGIARIAGTTVGLVISALLATITSGHTAAGFAVLLLAVGLAWYFFPISYGAMVLMLTIAIGQLYELLRTYSDQVLVLRLQETIVGAVIGAVVGIVVLPTSTLDTLKVARSAVLDNAADLLERSVTTLRIGRDDPSLLTAVIRLDDSYRQLSTLTGLLVHARFFGSRRQVLRHRVAVLGTIASTARKIAITIAHGVGGTTEVDREKLGALCNLLARQCRTLAAARTLGSAERADADRADEITDLLQSATPDGTPTPIALQLMRLSDALALLTPRGH